MLGTVTLTGGLLTAGIMAYRRAVKPSEGQQVSDGMRPDQKGLPQLLSDWRAKVEDWAVNVRAATNTTLWDGDQRLRFGLQTSTLSLGLTTAGLFLTAPFTYASLPVLIFMGVPPAQESYDALRQEGRGILALVETAALGICLVGGNLWIGSLGFSVYYLGRVLLQKRNTTYATSRIIQPVPVTAFLWQDDEKIEVPVSSLHNGDRIALESGNLSPVNGVIVEGSAWLKAAALHNHSSEVYKEAGDRVCLLDVVVVGHICVQVQSA